MSKTKKNEFHPDDFVVYPAHGVGRIVSIDHYGASAPYQRIYEELGLNWIYKAFAPTDLAQAIAGVRGLGIRVPVYPVKGYSLTVPITDPKGAPESTVMDETHKVAITRLGDRIRVGGMAELDGYNTTLRPARRATLEHVVSDLYPRGGDVDRASFWTGLRPMTPDGPPVIGRAKYGNLFLNTGHGTLGWTMACGSGRVLADLVSGHKPEIDTSGLDITRYARAA